VALERASKFGPTAAETGKEETKMCNRRTRCLKMDKELILLHKGPLVLQKIESNMRSSFVACPDAKLPNEGITGIVPAPNLQGICSRVLIFSPCLQNQ
jgi:hypothetical protein